MEKTGILRNTQYANTTIYILQWTTKCVCIVNVVNAISVIAFEYDWSGHT